MYRMNIIVAYDEERAIGSTTKQGLLWYIPEDFRLFRESTEGHTVIMGRKTWETLPKRPLPKRINIILTTQTVAPSIPSAYFSNSLEGCFKYISPNETEVFVMGGAQVYEQFLSANLIDRVIATEVKGKFGGNIFFPELNPDWNKGEKELYAGFNRVEFIRKLYGE